jgi:hypothetical protein
MNDKDYYRDNLLLKKPGVQYEFSEEEIEEYMKCAADPIYFIKNYVKIISLDEGLITFAMHDFQEEMVTAFNENRFSIVRVGRQSGKCESYKSLINMKNKFTGEIKQIEIGKFFESIKNNA